ncbi:hypothetical protein WN943_000826 [Citrus x changshan-huyou]
MEDGDAFALRKENKKLEDFIRLGSGSGVELSLCSAPDPGPFCR